MIRTNINIGDIKVYNYKMRVAIKGSGMSSNIKNALLDELDKIQMPLSVYARESDEAKKARYKGMVVARFDKIVNDLAITDSRLIDKWKEVLNNAL